MDRCLGHKPDCKMATRKFAETLLSLKCTPLSFSPLPLTLTISLCLLSHIDISFAGRVKCFVPTCKSFLINVPFR